MKLKLHLWSRIATFAILFAAPARLSADAVADWNAIAVQATVTGTRPGPSGVLDIATVQAAIYDAVQAIEKRFEPYYVEIPGASGSPEAAAAKAAHDVLVNRFPAQASSLDTTYQEYLSSRGLSETDPGVAVGASAAAGIIALRASDGSFPASSPPFTGGTAPGVWRPTPPGNLPMAAPWLGNVTPFTLTRPSQFRAAAPPALTSAEYAKDYNEVKAMGALNNSSRTPEQTDLAHFWNANYPVLWNQVLRDIAGAHVNNIAESARLFALADMAMADAIITAWNEKNRSVFWRPITAIQEGENDGNPETAGDSNWLSLINAPPYPDHTSGANNLSSAVTRALARFFETDRMTFSITTTNAGPTTQDTRTYERFSDAAQEVVDARIYEGIHFRFADEAARKQGKQVADWGWRNFMRSFTDDNQDTGAVPGVANISTRGFVQTGDNILIGGFIVTGATSTNVLVRAIGPTLVNAGVNGALEDTTLELFDGNGHVIASNDDWKSEQEQAIRDTTIPPNDNRESAILRSLSAGNYTAVVRGKNNTTGIALVEVYALQ